MTLWNFVETEKCTQICSNTKANTFATRVVYGPLKVEKLAMVTSAWWVGPVVKEQCQSYIRKELEVKIIDHWVIWLKQSTLSTTSYSKHSIVAVDQHQQQATHLKWKI